MKRLIRNVVIFLALVTPWQSAMAESAAVKNHYPVQGTSTKQEVLYLYTMKTRFWEDGTKITVFYQDRSAKAHKEFCKQVLEINPEKFDTILATALNSGNASYFRMARNDNDVYSKVELIDGAIGYLDEDTLVLNKGGKDVVKIRILP